MARTYSKAYQAMLDDSKKRRQRALQMKQGGKQYLEIGNALGVTRERARQMVLEAEAEQGSAK